MNYPQYFRKDGRCIRVDSPTKSWTIGLPPEFKVPVRSCDNYPSPEHLSNLLKDLDDSTEEEFKSFLFSFYKCVADERDLMRNQQTIANDNGIALARQRNGIASLRKPNQQTHRGTSNQQHTNLETTF